MGFGTPWAPSQTLRRHPKGVPHMCGGFTATVPTPGERGRSSSLPLTSVGRIFRRGGAGAERKVPLGAAAGNGSLLARLKKTRDPKSGRNEASFYLRASMGKTGNGILLLF